MLFPILPYSTLILRTLTAGIIIVLTSNNWLLLWVGLELNLISFIPIISSSQSNQREARVKYFLVQAVGSGLMLTRIIIILVNRIIRFYHLIPNFILLIRLLIKTGIAPCHFWFPQVIIRLRWVLSLILTTIQKISPLFIILFLISLWTPLILILLCTLNRIIGGIGGLNQTQIRSLIAYSSIGHLSWIIGVGILLPVSGLIYFSLYVLITSTLIIFIISLNKSSTNQFNMSILIPQHLSLVLTINLLSLAGLPPLIGFFPKWMAIRILSNFSPVIVVILISGSLINLFYYLLIFFSITINTLKSSKTNANILNQVSFLILSTIPLIGLISII